MQLRESSGNGHPVDGGTRIAGHSQTAGQDAVAKVVHRGTHECALRQLEGETGVRKKAENRGEVGDVRGEGAGKNDDVVQVDDGGLPAHGRENNVHRPLERRRGVSKPKGHTPEAEGSKVRGENREIARSVVDLELPVTLVAVER